MAHSVETLERGCGLFVLLLIGKRRFQESSWPDAAFNKTNEVVS